MPPSELVIDPRFRGPLGSGNGGYSCGLLGTRLGRSAEVNLRMPPPLDTPLRVEGNQLLAGDAVVAEGAAAEIEVAPPSPPPTLEEARAASAAYADDGRHPFPECFVCGPHREPGDGLRIFPSPAGEHPGLVAHWEAREVDPLLVWAAMDCPTGWCTPASGTSVLARLGVSILGDVAPGPHVLHAWPTASEGRKHFSEEALYDADGRLLAVARALWIELRDPAAFQARGVEAPAAPR